MPNTVILGHSDIPLWLLNLLVKNLCEPSTPLFCNLRTYLQTRKQLAKHSTIVGAVCQELHLGRLTSNTKLG